MKIKMGNTRFDIQYKHWTDFEQIKSAFER